MGFILFRNKNTLYLTEETTFPLYPKRHREKGKNVYFKHVVCVGGKT